MNDFGKQFKKRVYELSIQIIQTLETLPKDNASNIIAKQLIRSSTSILSNYIEGQSSQSRKELIRYLHIALKSTNESVLWVSYLKDLKKADSDRMQVFIGELKEVAKILAKAIISLKNGDHKS